MAELKTINDKLVEQAEAELQREIRETSDTFRAFLNDGTSHLIKVPLRRENGTAAIDSANTAAMGFIRWYDAFEALKTAAFELNRQQRCQQKINQFLAEFEQFKASLENMEERVNEQD